MLLVGLTGNIASGKSSVAKLFGQWGATLIDADALARQAVNVGMPAYHAIVERWGEGGIRGMMEQVPSAPAPAAPSHLCDIANWRSLR